MIKNARKNARNIKSNINFENANESEQTIANNEKFLEKKNVESTEHHFDFNMPSTSSAFNQQIKDNYICQNHNKI